MVKETSYTHARANLASLCDDVARTREAVIIHRRGARDVALVAADELESLMETAHLLRSPKNAERLLAALQRARSRRLKPQTIDKLRRDCCAPAWRYDEAGELQQCGHENGGQVDAHQSVEAHKNIVELPEASANTPA